MDGESLLVSCFWRVSAPSSAFVQLCEQRQSCPPRTKTRRVAAYEKTRNEGEV